jgi:hypothetical protein
MIRNNLEWWHHTSSSTQHAILLPQTNLLALLNTRPLKVNNSGFDLSLINIVLFNSLKKAKAKLKKAMKVFRKRKKVKDKMYVAWFRYFGKFDKSRDFTKIGQYRR